MILTWLILWLLIGGFATWLAGLRSNVWPRWISLFVLITHIIGLIVLWWEYLHQPASVALQTPWLREVNVVWIPELGIHYHLALDGLSLILILLSNFLGVVAVLASWTEINYRVGFFHFNLLWILAALVGLFLAIDMFLFYFFWEMMLVPLYFLIGIWGHERRIYATIKFFIFTQGSGLLMLLAILGLYFVHGHQTGVYTFDYMQLLGTQIDPSTAFWLMLGFFIAFAVKLPVFPVHTWLPDAHTQAPTAGSVDLAGLVLKVGGYGFLRFLVPLFPIAAHNFAPIAMTLGVIGIFYGAILAFSQNDLKRLVAYTSISHMGFVVLGIFAWNQIALQGAIMVMVAHGISTGALFILVGHLYERIRTRDLSKMGGLWSTVPRMGRVGLVLALASLGLPGLGNFVGEFMVLLGTFKVNVPIAIVATLGFVLATVYSLWMVGRIFTGPNTQGWKIRDFNLRELGTMTVMIAILLWFGLYPRAIFSTTQPSVDHLRDYYKNFTQQQTYQPQTLQPGSLTAQPVPPNLEIQYTPPGQDSY